MTAAAVPRRLHLNLRTPSEFAAAPDNGAVEQTAIRKIGEKRGEALVKFRQTGLHHFKMLFVRIPVGIGVVIDGDIFV